MGLPKHSLFPPLVCTCQQNQNLDDSAHIAHSPVLVPEPGTKDSLSTIFFIHRRSLVLAMFSLLTPYDACERSHDNADDCSPWHHNILTKMLFFNFSLSHILQWFFKLLLFYISLMGNPLFGYCNE